MYLGVQKNLHGCRCQTAWSLQNLLIYWDFHSHIFLGLTENCSKKKNIHENALLMPKEND